MKSASILSVGALFASASGSATHPNVHAVADLMARAIDPATMDPTKLSVLSVLKTAMPTPTGTETAIALPTGDVTPQWYKDLPADVMVLLAQMYPATSTSTSTSAAAVSETSAVSSGLSSSAFQSTASASASQSTLTKSLDHVPTVTGVSNGTLSSNNNFTSAVGTLSTSKPTPSQSAISTGVKNTVGTGSLSVAMGLSVAALFCLLA
ncbi:hypothetical protein E8E13_006436 [Curvularia kusanoi]|uniref:Uncharacterized protein n=1 Tax=Curvularia kusanoi TaxID=90978 RepID=A0A9P4WAX1_CURKU|nr:hypothetical protein E8E13_006436 [Curvularia kusanoi]